MATQLRAQACRHGSRLTATLPTQSRAFRRTRSRHPINVGPEARQPHAPCIVSGGQTPSMDSEAP